MRNQRFQTTDGFRSTFNQSIPLISEEYSLGNRYDFKTWYKLPNNMVTSLNFYARSVNSLAGDDVRITNRFWIPRTKLKGFKTRNIGPVDGTDYVGGNYISSINATTTIPKILENVQSVDVVLFTDIGNIWGVDYNSSLDTDEIRSSVGLGLDWLTPVGPLTFSLAHPITQAESDVTEMFRFNLGTSF